MPARRRPEGPHEHGYRVDSECTNELCRAYYRGYKRGLRARNRTERQRHADTIAELRAATRRPDYEDGPVVTRSGQRQDTA